MLRVPNLPQMFHCRPSQNNLICLSPGASSMSRSQLGPWPLWCRPRASGSAPRGNPGETGPGSRGFCAAPPERGHGRSGPDPRWTGTAPARTCSSPRMKGGTGRPGQDHAQRERNNSARLLERLVYSTTWWPFQILTTLIIVHLNGAYINHAGEGGPVPSHKWWRCGQPWSSTPPYRSDR